VGITLRHSDAPTPNAGPRMEGGRVVEEAVVVLDGGA